MVRPGILRPVSVNVILVLRIAPIMEDRSTRIIPVSAPASAAKRMAFVSAAATREEVRVVSVYMNIKLKGYNAFC